MPVAFALLVMCHVAVQKGLQDVPFRERESTNTGAAPVAVTRKNLAAERRAARGLRQWQETPHFCCATMISKRTIGLLFLGLCLNAFRIPAGAAGGAVEVRKAIQEATDRFLAALCTSGEQPAVLHPSFRAISPKDRHYPERAAHGRRERASFVSPQQTRLDDGTMAQMHLSKATSTIATLTMPHAGEAIVIGEETLIWTCRHGTDIVFVAPDGSRSVTPNTEQRTVTVTYRRYWVKTGRGWLLKRSRTLSEKATAIL